MNRLQAELHRLYAPPVQPGEAAADMPGQVRVVLLELARPADWAALAQVWRGVQSELQLAAPAIAVNGRDGFQLWFSLQEPLPRAQAQAFVEALRQHFLAHIAAPRMSTEAVFAELPPRQIAGSSEQWSAFVAPDLAPVFNEEPWLDTPPSAEGQADLLARLLPIKPADLNAALDRLGFTPDAAKPSAQPCAFAVPAALAGAAPTLDPRSFLLQVMNDPRVDMALRIDAAKALLPGDGERPARR